MSIDRRVETMRAAPYWVDVLRRGYDIPHSDQFDLVRLALAFEVTLARMIDPPLEHRDRERFEEDPSWQDGWDAAVDFIHARVDALLSTIDEAGGLWPDSADSFRRELALVYRKP